jgi:drug/metabolite transporter (DMT)-like permease
MTIENRNNAGADADAADLQGKLMLVALCLLWGVTWPLMKIALTDIPPLSMRTLTAGLGTLTLLLICLVTRRSLYLPAKMWGTVFVTSFLNIGAFSLLSAYAQMTAATSRVTILIYTMPIWAVLMAWLLLGERPTTRQGLAVILCIVGIAVLVYPLALKGVPLGLLLALATGVSWAAGTVYVKWMRLPLDPLVFAFWQVAMALVVIAASLLVVDGRLNLDNAHTGSLLATVFAGIVGSGIAYALWFAIVKRLSAATASLGALGNPAVGIVATVLMIGERPTMTDIVGFALILAASVCVLLAPSGSRAKVVTE